MQPPEFNLNGESKSMFKPMKKQTESAEMIQMKAITDKITKFASDVGQLTVDQAYLTLETAIKGIYAIVNELFVLPIVKTKQEIEDRKETKYMFVCQQVKSWLSTVGIEITTEPEHRFLGLYIAEVYEKHHACFREHYKVICPKVRTV